MENKKRGRKAIDVTPVELQWLIKELEQLQPEGKFPNRSALWAAIENFPWSKDRKPRPLTGQVAMTIAKKFNIAINTPVGKRGRQKGCTTIPNAGNKRKTISPEAEVALRGAFPLGMVTGYGGDRDKPFKSLPKIVENTIKGKLRAAVKLKCLECTNIQPVEIRNCTCIECPLWSFRPYKA